MAPSAQAFVLGPLLKRVSRSFYLTLRVLPPGMRTPVGLAYVLARAADTIADTSLIAPDARLNLLLSLRANVQGVAADSADAILFASLAREVADRQSDDGERMLLQSLREALDILRSLNPDDARAVRAIVTTLIGGMEFDLRTFPDERAGRLVALAEPSDLDRYTYMVAGCVGEFWTRMTYAHAPSAIKLAGDEVLANSVRFGKALQMTNILRDCSKDLRIGRCYLPLSVLQRHGLSETALLDPAASAGARRLLLEMMRLTLAHYRAALDYTLAIAPTFMRLRLACLWPIMIGLQTLELLIDNPAWLDPERMSKLKRAHVYRIMLRSLPLSLCNRLARREVQGAIERIEQRMTSLESRMAVA